MYGVPTLATNRSIRIYISKVHKFTSPESPPEFVGGCGGDVCCGGGGGGPCPDEGGFGGFSEDAGSAGSDPSESVIHNKKKRFFKKMRRMNERNESAFDFLTFE